MNWPIIRSGFIFILVLFSMSKSEGQISGALKIKGIPRELVWENKPKRFQVTPTSLQIISGEKTDMFRDRKSVV